MVVEVMGRHAGWIAAYSGIAAGADAILVPEWPYDTEAVCELLRERHSHGTTYSIVVVSEGAKPKDEGVTAIGKQAGQSINTGDLLITLA